MRVCYCKKQSSVLLRRLRSIGQVPLQDKRPGRLPPASHALMVVGSPQGVDFPAILAALVLGFGGSCGAVEQQSPTFLAPGTGFVEDIFSTEGRVGMVQAVMQAMGSNGEL